MRRGFPPRRSKPLRPGVHAARHWDPPTSWPPALSERPRHVWVPQRWTGALAQEGARKVNPPGAMRSKPQTPRAERRATGIFVVAVSVHFPLFVVHRLRGCRDPGVPRALFLRGRNESAVLEYGLPGAAKNTGDDARLYEPNEATPTTVMPGLYPGIHDQGAAAAGLRKSVKRLARSWIAGS